MKKATRQRHIRPRPMDLRRETVQQLTARLLLLGWSVSKIARRLHCTDRAVRWRMQQPEFQSLFDEIQQEHFKIVDRKLGALLHGACDALERLLKHSDWRAVWSTDRFGRSMPQLVRVLETLKAKGIALYDHRNSLDTSTPMGQAFYYMSGIFAEIERTMVVERIHAGLKRAKAEGKRLGRPTLSGEIATRVKDQLAGQVPIRKVALALGIAPGSVMRNKKTMATG
jgi:DNA invertase Pin-like site-specific DNA recombinase